MTILFTQQHDLAIDQNFVNRVRQAGLTLALDVLVETEANAELYAARESLALKFLNSPNETAKRLTFALVTASQLTTTDHTTISDAQLSGFLSSRWNTLAGYNPNS